MIGHYCLITLEDPACEAEKAKRQAAGLPFFDEIEAVYHKDSSRMSVYWSHPDGLKKYTGYGARDRSTF
jgi:hypothetical protein